MRNFHCPINLFIILNFGSIIIYIFDADEWKNFLSRIGRDENSQDTELFDSPSDILELRFWASYRAQTLARTGSCSFFSIFLKLILNLKFWPHYFSFIILFNKNFSIQYAELSEITLVLNASKFYQIFFSCVIQSFVF